MSNKYCELHEKQQAEIDAFPFMFAFNKKQFAEGMEKLGLKPDDYDKIYSIGAGGYIRKTDAKAMHEMFERHANELREEIAKDETGEGFIYDMFLYELENHEYCITLSIESTLEALGITLDEINASAAMQHGFKKARRKAAH